MLPAAPFQVLLQIEGHIDTILSLALGEELVGSPFSLLNGLLFA